MFSTIANGFSAVLDFLQTLISFIGRVLLGGAQLLASIPDIIRALTITIGVLPSVLVAAALFCITVRAVVIFLNRNAGGD